MNWDWVGLILNLIGCVFNAKKSIWCWPIWLAGNAAWLAYWIPKSELAAILLTCTYVALNIYGYREWKKLEKENAES